MEIKGLKYPGIREQMRKNLVELADKDILSKWFDEDYPNSDSNMGFIVNFFYDDTQLEVDSRGCIGVFLKDQAEAFAVDSLIEALEEILEKYDNSLSDRGYVEKPEWAKVREAAQSLLALIS